jgi:uncharacterized protein YciI
MYALALIRYRRPLEEVLVHHPAHRDYLQGLKAGGTLIASGPLSPRYGGALLLRVPDEKATEALNEVRDNDPYTKAGVGQYELLPWAVATGREDLDRL